MTLKSRRALVQCRGTHDLKSGCSSLSAGVSDDNGDLCAVFLKAHIAAQGVPARVTLYTFV